MFDTKAPQEMIRQQRWFATCLLESMQADSKLVDSHNAPDYIKPSSTLTAHERIEIYHQQYWWRLLRCLQENFPFLTRLFGHASFNQTIAIPYLQAHLPSHWGLNQLGATLPAYLENNYREEDCDLVHAAAKIDWAMQVAFWTGKKALVDFSSPQVMTKKVQLQPHVYLFESPADLLTFREKFLKEEVEYWSVHPFPELSARRCFFMIYRSQSNLVQWKELSPGEFFLLNCFKKGASIQEACEQMERTEFAVEAEEFLSLWFHEWTLLELFTRLLT